MCYTFYIPKISGILISSLINCTIELISITLHLYNDSFREDPEIAKFFFFFISSLVIKTKLFLQATPLVDLSMANGNKIIRRMDACTFVEITRSCMLS